MIVLPKEKQKAKVANPKLLILFGRPKAGRERYQIFQYKDFCRLYK